MILPLTVPTLPRKPSWRVPADIVVVEWLAVPVKIRTPAPVLFRSKAPLILPDKSKESPVTSAVLFAPRVTFPAN